MPGSDEPTFAVEFDGLTVRDQDVLMETSVLRHQPPHELRPDATPLVLRVDQEVRIVDSRVAVGYRVSEPDQTAAVPSGNQRVRASQRGQQFPRLIGRRPTVCPVEGNYLVRW